MLKLYDLLENLLLDIEKDIRNNLNVSILSKKYGFSEGYLRRLFSFAFKQPIASYIRSRRLEASINDILGTDNNIVEIAIENGFEYEQTYIRTFKHEFGITPGDLRKSGQIIKIKPPLNLFDENKLGESIFFGPDIVMVPQFHVIGKCYKLSLNDSRKVFGSQFWNKERMFIKSIVNPNVYIGITRNFNKKTGEAEYMPSVQVKNFKNIPEGFRKDTFDTSLCARFCYIGQHHYSNIDRNVASSMYNTIIEFTHNNKVRYELSIDKVYFEKIDTKLSNENYCQMEWFAPVSEKNK
jgi:AraC family transcriptional regulator